VDRICHVPVAPLAALRAARRRAAISRPISCCSRAPSRGARGGVKAALLQRDVITRQRGEDLAALAQDGNVVPRLAAGDRVEVRLQFAPVFLEPEMVLLQPQHCLLHCDAAARRQLREDVAFLILVVLARSGREMAHDGGRHRARLRFDRGTVEPGDHGLELVEGSEGLPVALVEHAEGCPPVGRRLAIGTWVRRGHEGQPRAVDATRG
jgi:hypothetical protein